MTEAFDRSEVTADQTGQTLAAFLRKHLPGRSWNEVRRLIETRHVRVGNDVCVESARRLSAGEVVQLGAQPAPRPKVVEDKVIRYLDQHVVVAEKATGISTVRHPSEREWSFERKQRSPTLEDILPPLIVAREGKARKGPLPRLRVVQRIDKETSGLVVFARTPQAQRELAKQFRTHTVVRRYLAVVPGIVTPQRIASNLVRDRGDGRRGSNPQVSEGKLAITHVSVLERFKDYSVLECRLETGRTHQIRIHLSELGHPICGDAVYHRKPDGTILEDASEAPRLALHAAELGFEHPVTKELLHWTMPLPGDLQAFVDRLRGAAPLERKPHPPKPHGNQVDRQRPRKR